MKANKFLKNVGMILFLGIVLVGCTPNNNSSDNVSLDFLVTPEELIIHSDTQLKELNEIEKEVIARTESMKEKYDDISKMSVEDIKTQDGLAKQVMDVLDSGKTIENKDVIEKTFNQLRRLEGVYVDQFEEQIKTRIELIEDPETASEVSSNNSYLRILILLENDSMLIPKGIIGNSTNTLEPAGEIEYIKVKLPKKLKDELEELIKS